MSLDRSKYGANSAPSECRIGLNSTTNWKPLIEVWKVVGANCAPSKIDSTINLKESLQMAWVPWWSCAWITWQSFAWITWQNFTWIVRRRFAWIPWWIARRMYRNVAAPSEAGITLTINLKESLQTEACLAPVENDSTINWSEKLARSVVIIAGASLTQKSKRLEVIVSELSSLWSRKRHSTISWSLGLAWFVIVIAGSSWTESSKRFWAWVAVIIAGLSWLKGSKRLAWVAVIIAELSWSKGSKRLGVTISELSSSRSRKRLVSCVAGFKALEFISSIVWEFPFFEIISNEKESILFSVFGFLKACTPKTNALQLVE